MYSVVMAVHNGEHYIDAALDSIFAQSLPPSQVIVVNDSSKDKTGYLLQARGDKVLVLECNAKNQSFALNLGIKHVTSEFVAFLDHDDLWIKDKQAEQIQLLKEIGADCICGGVSNFNSEGMVTYLGPARVLGATTFRSFTFERVGFLDETAQHHSVFNWWLRASVLGLNEVRIDREHLLRRIHSTNFGITHQSEARRAMIKEIRAHLRREI